LDEIDRLEKEHRERPAARSAQRALAADVTDLVHGQSARLAAESAAEALFGRGELRGLGPDTLSAALAETPHAAAEPSPAGLPSLVDALVLTGLCASRGAARRAVAEGGAYVNNARVVEGDSPLPADAVLPGGWVVLRRGKRAVAGLKVHAATSRASR
jgi:tyrosyl-tRNA synthetase